MHSHLFAPPAPLAAGRPAPAELVASAGLAATSVEGRTDDALRVIDMAVRGGLAAATLGARIPLFLLIDVAALLSSRRPSRLIPENGRASRAATLAYDQWLRRLLEAFPVPVSAIPDSVTSRPRTLPRERGFLPLLIDAWSRRKRHSAGSCLGWASAYRELAKGGDLAHSVLKAWSAPRTEDAAAWQTWFPSAATDAAEWPRPSAISALWSCWAAASSEQPQETWLHEEFDHEAAACWLAAGPAGTPRRLWPAVEKLRRRSLEDDRVRRESIEEPHPIDGRIRMALLTRGRYGIFQIVNGAWKFADYPRSDVLLDLHVHLALCRAGRRAADRRVRFPSQSEFDEDEWFLPEEEPDTSLERPSDGTISAASLLHATGAMLLDDLRAALVGLNVQFHPHTTSRSDRDEYSGRLDVSPGPAWRPQLLATGRPRLPPAEVIRALFRRRTCVDDWEELARRSSEAGRDRAESSTPLEWTRLERMFPGAAEWFVGLALLEDLEKAGWSPPGDAGASAWILPPTVRIPQALNHLILLHADDFSGQIFEVERAGAHRRGPIRLRPWRRHSVDPTRGHDTLRPLRGAALELAFEALSFPARYRS